ncbi:MAG: CHASE3 domain-containing protein [Terracidiphilus sp.]|jgi:PAS domain S-box-containing protein
MEYSTFKSLLRQMIVVPMVIMAAFAGLLLWETYDLNKSVLWVDHTSQVLDRSGHLLNLMIDMESGTRGYIATGDESFLQPYLEAEKRLDPEYQALYGMMADNLPQQQRLKEIHDGYVEWEEYASKIIALRRAGKADPTLYENQQGKRRMDALREQISDFQNVEAGLRVERVQAAHVQWVVMVTSFLGLGLGVAVFLAMFTRYHVEQLGTKLLQSEERWTATLGSIGEAVIATDSEGRITFLNPIAAALTGFPSEEALNQPIGNVLRLINEKSGMTADNEVLRVLKEKQVLSVANHVDLVTRDGREIAVEHSAAPILAGKGKVIGVVLVFRDVAERRQEQVATAEQAALLELTQDSVFVIDLEGAVLFWSRGAEAMLGYSKSQAAGTISHELLHTEFPKPIAEIRAELTRVGHWEGDLIITSQEGKRIVVSSRWALQWGKRDQAPRVLVINSDITERKLGEESLVLQREQLRALAERLQWVREEDRKRVARDLHDQIGQILTAIKMDMTWMTRHLQETEVAVLSRIKESIQLINDGVKAVRTICSGLRPGVLDDLGLAAAIEWQANEFASRNGVRCKVSVPPVDLHLDGDRATATFRIFQECLTNVIRHAQAKSVRVDLCQEEESILLVVQDDGIGFSESGFSNAFGSLGLLGMKERAQFCGGDMQISSSLGNGTTVTVRVPLDIPRAERSETCTS